VRTTLQFLPFWRIRSIISENWYYDHAHLCGSAHVWTIQLMHPILDAFNGTPHEWIKKLLFTFNEGSIGKFEALAPLFPQEVSMLFAF